MPYITAKQRVALDPYIEAITGNVTTLGEMNYVLTRLLTESPATRGQRYRDAVYVLGSLAAVGLEYYRRQVGPHEDDAIALNGDIPAYSTVPEPDRTPGTTQAVQEPDR